MGRTNKKNSLTAYGRLSRFVNVTGLLLALLWTSPTSAEPLKILALGDSLTAGYGLNKQDGFTEQLQAALRAAGHDLQVINAGVSGDTTAGGLARLDWALADKPHAAIVELGANDGLRGLEPSETKANLSAILDKLRAKNIPTLLTGMLAPPNLGEHYGQEFNALYPALAKRDGVALYPFFLDGVAADPQLNQPDGIHPTKEGVAVIVERLLPFVRRLIRGE